MFEEIKKADSEKPEEQVKKRCAKKIRAFISGQKSTKGATGDKQVKRFEFETDNIDPLGWLNQQQNSIKTYWSDRKITYEMAGVGSADIVTGETAVDYNDLFNRLNKNLGSQNSRLRYYGGISFNQEEIQDENWLPFGTHRFIIPRFEVFRENKKTFFACNIFYFPEDDAARQLQEILSELDGITFSDTLHNNISSALVSRQNFPEFSQWSHIVTSALKSIRKGEFEKVVLARKSKLEFQSKLNAFSILKKIKKKILI